MVDLGVSGVVVGVSGHVAAVGGAVLGGTAGRVGVRVLHGLKRPVRPRRGWCEVSVALTWAIVLAEAAFGVLPWWWVPVPLLLGWFAALLATCDVLTYRLPDALTVAAYPVTLVALGLAAAVGRSPGLVGAALLGSVLFVGCYGGVRLVAGDGLGPGDVKLSGSLGAAVGAVSPGAVLLVMAAAAVITIVWASLRRGAVVPHGPAMLGPAWLVTALPGLWPCLPPGCPVMAAGAVA